MTAMKLALRDIPAWFRADDQEVWLADFTEPGETGALSLAFSRYGAGTSMDWEVSYDEVMVVLRGAFTVTLEDGQRHTAGVGELLFVAKGTKLTYSADEETDMVVVTQPHWQTATEKANLHHLLEGFHEVLSLGD